MRAYGSPHGRLSQLRNHGPAIGHEDDLAVLDLTQVAAEVVLRFLDCDGLHRRESGPG